MLWIVPSAVSNVKPVGTLLLLLSTPGPLSHAAPAQMRTGNQTRYLMGVFSSGQRSADRHAIGRASEHVGADRRATDHDRDTGPQPRRAQPAALAVRGRRLGPARQTRGA